MGISPDCTDPIDLRGSGLDFSGSSSSQRETSCAAMSAGCKESCLAYLQRLAQ